MGSRVVDRSGRDLPPKLPVDRKEDGPFPVRTGRTRGRAPGDPQKTSVPSLVEEVLSTVYRLPPSVNPTSDPPVGSLGRISFSGRESPLLQAVVPVPKSPRIGRTRELGFSDLRVTTTGTSKDGSDCPSDRGRRGDGYLGRRRTYKVYSETVPVDTRYFGRRRTYKVCSETVPADTTHSA